MLNTLEKPEVAANPLPLYEMAMGFAVAKTLLAAHRLGIFESLKMGSKTAAGVASEQGLSTGGAEELLDACSALRLCRKTGDRYANSPLVENFLLKGKPQYLGSFMDHFNDHMYPTWFYLEDGIRSGHAQIQRVIGEGNDHFFQAIDHREEDLETFMLTMHEHSLLEGRALAAAYDFSTHREMLDVGGGTGAMTLAILEAAPHLRGTVFDRPPVCKIAERKIREAGQEDRIRVCAGSFFTDALPSGADLLLLSGILHNWSPANASAILKRCAEALSPGGTLLISDQILNDDRTGPVAAVLCSLNMLLMMDGGREYSQSELRALLVGAGFDLVEIRSTGSVRQLLVARRR
jgi:predicted O-methyltransferase YrrM